jgi:flagellar hook-basal body complex protein FliE
MIDAISGTTRSFGVGAGADITMAPASGSTPAASAEAGVDFGSFLAQLASDTTSTVKAGEATALAGINGQATTNQVVQAVMTAEQTLQAAIAIRDKVVTAFLEIGRMQI